MEMVYTSHDFLGNFPPLSFACAFMAAAAPPCQTTRMREHGNLEEYKILRTARRLERVALSVSGRGVPIPLFTRSESGSGSGPES